MSLPLATHGKSVLIDTFFKVIFVANDFSYYACYQADSGLPVNLYKISFFR
jgi:hypothetical protein